MYLVLVAKANPMLTDVKALSHVLPGARGGDPIQNIKFRPPILLNLYLTIYFHFRPELN